MSAKAVQSPALQNHAQSVDLIELARERFVAEAGRTLTDAEETAFEMARSNLRTGSHGSVTVDDICTAVQFRVEARAREIVPVAHGRDSFKGNGGGGVLLGELQYDGTRDNSMQNPTGAVLESLDVIEFEAAALPSSRFHTPSPNRRSWELPDRVVRVKGDPRDL